MNGLEPGSTCVRQGIVRGVAIAALVVLGACGGGSTPVSPPRPQPPAPLVISFVGQTNPDDNTILLTQQSSSATELVLAVTANSLADLFGFGLDVVFDPTILGFVDAAAGTFLSGDGISVTTQVAEPTPGTLVIGQSRVGAVAGVSGTGVTLTLRFRAVGAGTSTLTIANSQAFDSLGADLMSEFFGGAASVPLQ